MINSEYLEVKMIAIKGSDCSNLDMISVEMLDERPLACANKSGAIEEKGVFLEIDAAMCNRAVLQLGQTHLGSAKRSSIALGECQ